MLDAHLHLYQRLTSSEIKLFDRFVRQAKGSGAKSLAASVVGYPPSGPGTPTRPPVPTTHSFPLVAIGGYVQTVSGVPTAGDFAAQTSIVDKSKIYDRITFAAAQSALADGASPSGDPTLVADVNAEANAITALICHADGGQPGRVCDRPAVRRILKHIK